MTRNRNRRAWSQSSVRGLAVGGLLLGVVGTLLAQELDGWVRPGRVYAAAEAKPSNPAAAKATAAKTAATKSATTKTEGATTAKAAAAGGATAKQPPAGASASAAPATKPAATADKSAKPASEGVAAKAPDGGKSGPTAAGAKAPAAAKTAVTTSAVKAAMLPAPAAEVEGRTTYAYNAIGRRDPFTSMAEEFVGDDVGGDAPVDVGAVKVVGIVWGDDSFALIEDPRGNSRILRRGDQVMNGTVEELKRDGIVVRLTADGQTQHVSIPLTRKGESNGNR